MIKHICHLFNLIKRRRLQKLNDLTHSPSGAAGANTDTNMYIRAQLFSIKRENGAQAKHSHIRDHLRFETLQRCWNYNVQSEL